MDRVHRGLQLPHKDGLPRDIIVKPHFYAVKQGVMKTSRALDKLLHVHQVQIFTDLSPYTVQKRHALKPLLQVLMQKEIMYRWAFSLRLNFSYQNKPYGFSSFGEGEHLLTHLGIITQEISQPTASRGPPSTKRPSPPSPLTSVWQKQQPKRLKDSCPP